LWKEFFVVESFGFFVNEIGKNYTEIVHSFFLYACFPVYFIEQLQRYYLILLSSQQFKSIFNIRQTMRSLSYFKQLHKLFKADLIFELKSLQTNILEMFRWDEISYPVKDCLEGFLVDFAIDCMQVEHFHEGLSLCGFDTVLMFVGLFVILEHFILCIQIKTVS